jgi:hypothetical protein
MDKGHHEYLQLQISAKPDGGDQVSAPISKYVTVSKNRCIPNIASQFLRQKLSCDNK